MPNQPEARVTPGGSRAPNHIFRVPTGGSVGLVEDRWVVKDGEGAVMDSVATLATSGALAWNGGWITSARARGDCVVASLAADWVVPAPPTNASGQTIYLFSAVRSDRFDIIQPVLTWDTTVDPLGSWWIASWMVTRDGNAFCSPAVDVAAGAVLQGRITAAPGGGFMCEFAGELVTRVTFDPGTNAVYNSFVVLEGFNWTACDQLPADDHVSFTDVSALLDGVACPAPGWKAYSSGSTCGSETAPVLTPGGSVTVTVTVR